jgi:ankyrin repeat protein
MTVTTRNSSINSVNRDIIWAAKEGDAQLLQSLLEQVCPANILVNALCYSAGNGHQDCCRVLLDKDTDINGVGLYGSTPLSTAAGALEVDIVVMLLQCGADVFTRDEIGRTALLTAILNSGDLTILRMLLDAGADANMEDSRGLTPLWATLLETENPESMRLLLEYGADATKAYFGKTLLGVVRKKGLMEFESVLVEFQK